MQLPAQASMFAAHGRTLDARSDPLTSEDGRLLNAHKVLWFGEAAGDSEHLDPSQAWSNGTLDLAGGVITACHSGLDAALKLKLVQQAAFDGNGMTVRFKLQGWRSLRQVLLGFVHDGVFRRLSVPNPCQGQWLEVAFGLADLCFGLQNAWQVLATGQVTDVHVHVDGTPESEAGELQVSRVALWDERPRDFAVVLRGETSSFSALCGRPRARLLFSPIGPSLFEALRPCLARQFPDVEEHAEAFMSRGALPSHRALLDWPYALSSPPLAAEINTYRWSWHGLHPAIVLLTYARRTGMLAPVFAARDFVTDWLERSYYRIDPDQKYCWYDQGVSDRLLALVLLWDFGLRLDFDQRVMLRLLEAISSHARLLACEGFYASHQRTRYHNHALLQDLGLLFASLAVPELQAAGHYFRVAASRIAEQVEHLLVRERDFAILIENSVSYHFGLQDWLEGAERMLRLGGLETTLTEPLSAMRRFTAAASYPDGRLPGYGDSPRVANPATNELVAHLAYEDPQLVVLPRAGHVFAKGNHAGRPFMLSVLATSLCETHKHEDNLSFTLYFDGVEWLIDPSFFAYETSRSEARYLRKAVAHNALVLPGLPYSTVPGVACLVGEREGEAFAVRGHHSAYGAILVEREIAGRLDRLDLRFCDRVRFPPPADPEAGSSPAASLMLHCGDGVVAKLEQDGLTLRHPASRFALRVRLPTEQCRLYCDEEEAGEPRGLTGLGYLERAPITTVACRLPAGELEQRWEINAVAL